MRGKTYVAKSRLVFRLGSEFFLTNQLELQFPFFQNNQYKENVNSGRKFPLMHTLFQNG